MDELAEQVAESAAKAVALSESQSSGELDFTQASLLVVEAMLAEAVPYAADLTPGQLSGLIQQFGSYILEVGRREFGGRYLWHDERDQPVLVIGEPTFRVAMLAWDKVRDRVGGDTGDNIPFFYSGFAERARQAKPGDDALYV